MDVYIFNGVKVAPYLTHSFVTNRERVHLLFPRHRMTSMHFTSISYKEKRLIKLISKEVQHDPPQ